MFTTDHLKKFEQDGFVIIEDFLTQVEIETLRTACSDIVDKLDPNEHKCIFTTTDSRQASDLYFIESGDKIRYFFEASAGDNKGNLCVSKDKALNKIGHALHWLESSFKEVTFSKNVADVCRVLNFKQPVVAQSMYIFKQPQIGGEVKPHQDGSYLYTEPMKVVGFWIALEDVTIENGCLWFIPGSQTKPINIRLTRNPSGIKGAPLTYTGPLETYNEKDFVPAPCKKGSCIVIHGQVVHKSEQNRSSKSRHIYTFHVLEEKDVKYPTDNWLQPTSSLPFPHLYQE
ncbi:phytanoyl-CoA dioxygenase domain-containing protein 1-like isoform X2 [Artemia franciscana]|uniref:phytanoyl-CoA dioxygenase domain-containing protein 1-like isoform X2 n=1 Tax=Artemia franciscana TaxID=6661 RepID=UPI0032DA8B5F